MEVTQLHRSSRVAAALAIASALVLSGCAVSTNPDGDTTVLKVAASAAVTTWNPVTSFSTEALYMGNVYETLIWANPEGAGFSPGLAETWEASEDGLTWTFNIREGATFHDGEPVTAEAVKLSIEAAATKGGASFIWAPLDSVEATDEYTAVFNLKYPAPLDLIAASTYGAWIVSPAALAAVEADDSYFESGKDAGSGPYTVDGYTPGSSVVLKRYDAHWNQDALPYYSIVDVAITPDAVTAQQMLTSGEVDLATTLPLENIDSVANSMGATVRTSNSPFNFVALLNTTRPPLDNPLVRQALSYAVPYDDIIDVGAAGYGTQSRAAVPKGIFPYSESTPLYTQDLDKARDLLAQAGHEGGGFDLVLTYASENAAEARFVPLIKDAFEQIGVNVEVRGELFNQQWENAKADPATAQDIFVVYYWPTYSDAGSDNLWSLFHSSDVPFFNLSYWKNEQFDTLIDDAAVLAGSDRAASQAKYEEAMELLVDQAPALFLYDVQAILVTPSNLNVGQFNENYPFTTFFGPISPAS
ncbi:MAG: ABC transporter substrate-binding protein [Cryobacterium sp.]|nr:ABC transporter substrate-binding protein [Cryobacterium sp.]